MNRLHLSEVEAKKTKVIKMSVNVTKENLKVPKSGLWADTEVGFLTPSCVDLFSISKSADRLVWMSAFLCVVGLTFQKHWHMVRNGGGKKPPRKYQNSMTLLRASHSGHVDLLPSGRSGQQIVFTS